MHATQLEILESLRRGESCKFNELMSDVAETSDNLTYHLKRLMTEELIDSSLKGEYSLAKKGIMYVNNNLELSRDLFPTVSCMLELTDAHGHYLMMKKLKQPYLGKKHLPTFGVTSEESILRQIELFFVKYQIEARNIVFKCNYRERIKDADGRLVFDKFFVVYTGVFSAYLKAVADREFLVSAEKSLLADPDTLQTSKAVIGLSSDSGFIDTLRQV